MDYLANRPEPLHGIKNTHKVENKAKQSAKGKIRRVKTGVVPDFVFNGKGVKVADMLDNSPAQKAGIKTGDVIVKVNGKEIENLSDYSNILKTFSPGDTAKFTVNRKGKLLELKIKLEEK